VERRSLRRKSVDRYDDPQDIRQVLDAIDHLADDPARRQYSILVTMEQRARTTATKALVCS
jgi:hypothetical protein